MPSPVALLGDRESWEVSSERRAEHAATGAVLEHVGEDSFELIVPISGSSVRIPLRVDRSIADGGSPRIERDDAAGAMREILTVAAGGRLTDVVDGVAVTTIGWSADGVADHAVVTANTLPAHLHAVTPAQPFGFAAVSYTHLTLPTKRIV